MDVALKAAVRHTELADYVCSNGVLLACLQVVDVGPAGFSRAVDDVRGRQRVEQSLEITAVFHADVFRSLEDSESEFFQ